MALDPTALSYLLKVTGPARTADGQVITSENVVARTQRDLYVHFGSSTTAGTAQRKAYVVGLSRAIAERLAHGGNGQRLVRADGARGRASGASSSGARRRPSRSGSSPPGGPAPSRVDPAPRPLGSSSNNAAGGKLDYYLQRSLTYARQGCGVGSSATATIRLTNAAPTGLPAYVTTRADTAPRTAAPGDNRLLVTYFASAGARIESVTLDGKAVPVTSATENGLTTVSLDVELPRTQSRTIRVRIAEPSARVPVEVVRQPLVHAEQVHLEGDRCGADG